VGHFSEGHACRVRLSEGPACQVRRTTFDHLFRFCGHDKHAPPNSLSEGPACQVRIITVDNPLRFIGHDERAPPARAEQAYPSIWLIMVPPNLMDTFQSSGVAIKRLSPLHCKGVCGHSLQSINLSYFSQRVYNACYEWTRAFCPMLLKSC